MKAPPVHWLTIAAPVSSDIVTIKKPIEEIACNTKVSIPGSGSPPRWSRVMSEVTCSKCRDIFDRLHKRRQQ